MPTKPRYSIKKYIFLIVLSMTIGFIIAVVMFSIIGSIIGLPCQGILVIIVVWFPLGIFVALKGFYKGLVKYYGLKEDGDKGGKRSRKK